MKEHLKNILKLIQESINEYSEDNSEDKLIGIGVVLVCSKGKNLLPKEYLVTEGDISYQQIIATATSAQNCLLPKSTQNLPSSYLNQTRPRENFVTSKELELP